VGAFWGVHKHWLKPVYLSITDGVALCKFMNAVRQTDRQRERQTDRHRPVDGVQIRTTSTPQVFRLDRFHCTNKANSSQLHSNNAMSGAQLHISPVLQSRIPELKGKGRPHSIAKHRVMELIPVLGSQPTGDVSHKPGSRLPLLTARPAVVLTTIKRAATNFTAW